MANTRKITDEQVVAAYLVERIEEYAVSDRTDPKVKSFDYAYKRGLRGDVKFLDHQEQAYASDQVHLFSHADFCIIAARGAKWQRQKRRQAEQHFGRSTFQNGLRAA